MLENFEKKNDLGELYRWRIFHLGAWWRITKNIYRSSQHVSSYNKIYCWMFLRESQFLDLSIKPIDGELNTDLFDKPTDTHQF